MIYLLFIASSYKAKAMFNILVFSIICTDNIIYFDVIDKLILDTENVALLTPRFIGGLKQLLL